MTHEPLALDHQLDETAASPSSSPKYPGKRTRTQSLSPSIDSLADRVAGVLQRRAEEPRDGSAAAAPEPAPAPAPAPAPPAPTDDPFGIHLTASTGDAGAGNLATRAQRQAELITARQGIASGAVTNAVADAVGFAGGRGRTPAPEAAPLADALAPEPAASAPTSRDPAAPRQPVQRASDGALGGAPVGALAGAAVATPSESLPFASTIQRAFGRHDVSTVQAHRGERASAISDQLGARAFATGSHVVFRDQPDLHLAAHEAAHVVQQRAGIQPSGGVGEVGDRHEQHADRVADAVVSGESAEALLDEYHAGGASGADGAVQLAMDTNRPSLTIAGEAAAPNVNLPAVANPTEHYTTVSPGSVVVDWRRMPSRGLAKDFPKEAFAFHDKVRAIDVGTLQAIDDHRLILDTNIAIKGAAIDTAVANDRASGVKLETGLENAVVAYREKAGMASSAATLMTSARGQISSVANQITALVRKENAERSAKNLDDAEAAETAQATEQIAKARSGLNTLEGAALDTLSVLLKAGISRDVTELPGAGVDLGNIWAKIAVQYWNEEQQDAETNAKVGEIKASFATAREHVTAENAAALAAQIAAKQQQIEALKLAVEGHRAQLATSMTAAAGHMATILKNSSPVTALAAIQDYIRTVTEKAERLRGHLDRLRPLVTWPHAATSATMIAWLSSTLSSAAVAAQRWRDKKPDPDYGIVDHALPGLLEEYDRWTGRMQALIGWTSEAQMWFLHNEIELRVHDAFISGPHMAKANEGLDAIAALGNVM